MWLTILRGEGVIRLEVDGEMELDVLRGLIEIETSVPIDRQRLLYEGREIKDGTLASNGVGDDMVIQLMEQQATQQSQASVQIQQGPQGPLGMNAAGLLNRLQNDPNLQPVVRNHPQLARAVSDRNADEAARIVQQMAQQAGQGFGGGGPQEMSAEGQAMIEKQIQQQNIKKNLMDALDHNPESFARSILLYIQAKVNGLPVTAMVDTGAQITVMTLGCARRLGLERLIDTQYKTMLGGLGTQTSVGRIHLAIMQVADQFLHCSFTVVQDMKGVNGLELIFGLDMMRKHAIVVDIPNNCLRIHDSRAEFLAEKDLPKQESVLESQANQAGPATTAGQSATASGPSQAQPSGPPPPEEKVRRLMELGFQREIVVEALHAAQGNEEVAANILAQSM